MDVSDVKYRSENVLVSSGDDGHFCVWDSRDMKSAKDTVFVSDVGLNTVIISPHNDFYLATGGEDGTVYIFDLRAPKTSLNTMDFHKDSITTADWSPTVPSFIATADSKGMVYVWDISQVGKEMGRADYDDGPPELVLPNEMHRSGVDDVCWSPTEAH